ncbi:MAG: carbohydrate ABC transporter permease [Candidatus Caccosoma sp.]|nr:carbohydrate ABC transporter permease [Candidatus Caccosoma sp.]
MIKSKGEKIFDVCNVIFMIIFALIFIIPILLLINSSFTGTKALTLHGYSLIIRDFSLEYYKAIFSMESNQFVISILNSLFVVVCTTVLMIFTTSLAAYALTRKKLQFKKFFTYYFIISMLFSGGTIPYYILINNLGLMNTLWALILPSGVSAWYILLARKFFQQVPEALIEAAELDGANNLQILFKVVLPLNLPIIATISLYTSVAMWNDWFAASLFIDSNHYQLWPIQAFIRRIEDSDEFLKAYFGDTNLNYGGLRSAAVIISLIPIVLVYPFLQKFFIKGSLEGGVKE